MREIFHGWWIVAAGSVIIAMSGGFFWHGFTVFFLPLCRNLGVGRTEISLLYGASRLEGGFEGPVVGHLIDRFGPKRLIMLGAILAGIGFIMLTMAQDFLGVFLIYVLVVYLGHNIGFYHPVSAAVNSWFIRRRAICLSVVTAGGGIGGALLTPLLSYTVLNFGWRAGAILAGLTILIVVLPLSVLICRSPEERGLYPDGGPSCQKSALQQGDQVSKKRLSLSNQRIIDIDFTVMGALRTLSYWLLAIGITMRIAVTSAIGGHMIPILVWKGVDEASAAYLVGLHSFSVIIITLLMGWLGDRYNKALLSAIAILISLGGIVWLLMSESPVASYLFPIAWAVVMGTTPLNWSLIADFFGRSKYATLRGIMGLMYGTGTFVSPIYAGWIFDRTQSYFIVLVTFSIMFVVAASLFASLRPPLRRKKL